MQAARCPWCKSDLPVACAGIRWWRVECPCGATGPGQPPVDDSPDDGPARPPEWRAVMAWKAVADPDAVEVFNAVEILHGRRIVHFQALRQDVVDAWTERFREAVYGYGGDGYGRTRMSKCDNARSVIFRETGAVPRGVRT